jgi:hypothetical protein
MKTLSRLAQVAARRLEEHRRVQTGPVAELQKALRGALLRGDLTECMACVKKIDAIRGPQPPSPEALVLIERLNRRFAAEDALRAGSEHALRNAKASAS